MGPGGLYFFFHDSGVKMICSGTFSKNELRPQQRNSTMRGAAPSEPREAATLTPATSVARRQAFFEKCQGISFRGSGHKNHSAQKPGKQHIDTK